MSKVANGSRADWADDEDFEDTPTASLPQQQVIQNKDGTKTVITYRYNDAGQKVKITRRIRTTIIKETVNPRIAERRAWAKFGLEKGKPAGPDLQTTTIGENIIFRPSLAWKKEAKDEGKMALEGEVKGIKDQLKDKKVKCRICSGEHYTMKCPFKDTMAPVDDGTNPGADSGADGDALFGAGGEEPTAPGGKYVAPGKRGGGGAGEKMGGRFGDRDRDDMATLRITNVSDVTEEDELRALFNRGAGPSSRVTRVFLAKDRETGRAKGFAFVSFDDRDGAARAMAAMDGYGLHHLILKVEFAKRPQ